MRALYIGKDGAIRIEDPWAGSDGKPLPEVKRVKMGRIYPSVSVQESEIPAQVPFTEELYLLMGPIGDYWVYEQRW